MTTVNIETKHTAPEPDRSEKFVANGTATLWENLPSVTDPLVYVEGNGWTWHGTLVYYTWDEYVEKHHAHFPLDERETKVEVTGSESLDLRDASGDTLKVRVNSMSNRVEIGVIAGYGERSTLVYLRNENLLALRDALNAHIKEV